MACGFRSGHASVGSKRVRVDPVALGWVVTSRRCPAPTRAPASPGCTQSPASPPPARRRYHPPRSPTSRKATRTRCRRGSTVPCPRRAKDSTLASETVARPDATSRSTTVCACSHQPSARSRSRSPEASAVNIRARPGRSIADRKRPTGEDESSGALHQLHRPAQNLRVIPPWCRHLGASLRLAQPSIRASGLPGEPHPPRRMPAGPTRSRTGPADLPLPASYGRSNCAVWARRLSVQAPAAPRGPHRAALRDPSSHRLLSRAPVPIDEPSAARARRLMRSGVRTDPPCEPR